ncbi:glutamine synthetase family protein [Vulcanisaeta thermophila]|uniref:glutamine synthetase family protein n=1 Tax=Vulcanisaeta thermophila TaxID=867917 RepID=UPI003F75A837
MEPIDLWRVLKGAGIKYVKFIIVDINGAPRSEIVPIDMAKDLFIDGMPFDASSVPSYSTVNKSDFVAYVDPRAVYIEYWLDNKVADVFTLISDIGNKPSPLDPRRVLDNILKDAKSKGYEFLMGVEMEHFVVKEENGKPTLADTGIYFDGWNITTLHNYMKEIVAGLAEAGINYTKIHHEVAPSQYEVNIGATDPLRLADQIIYFKIMAKDIAQKYGLRATFMPKPFWGMNGSGAHTHISVWKDGRNLFQSNTGKITEECGYAISSILSNARALSAFVAPLVNSYKRLVPHYEAPTRLVWGYANRSAMIRIPQYKMRINRIEYRHPDPSMNPYLAFATIVLTILKGLDEKKEPPPPTDEVAYELPNAPETPATIEDAVRELSKSFLASALPSELVSAYIRMKLNEWEDYLTKVGSWEKTWNVITDWEYSRYLITA